MDGSGLSASDVLAMTKGSDGFLEGNGIIILILFFLIFGFGGNWGGNKTSDAASTADLYSSLGSQDLKNDVRSGFAAASNAICNTDKEILNNRFTTQLGFQNLASQMDSCCCSTKQLIMSEAQATRELIQTNYIDGLRTALSDEKAKNSNLMQTQNILDTIFRTQGRWVGYTGCGSCASNCNCGC